MKTLPIRFTGGLDRSAGWANSPSASLSFLKGWKPNTDNPKELVSCRGFIPNAKLPYNVGTYWAENMFPVADPPGGASHVEPNPAPTTIIFPDGTAVKDETVWQPAPAGPGLQMRTFFQELFNAASPPTIWDQCFITINDVTGSDTVPGMIVVLGQPLQIYNDTPTTFAWRIGGNPYSGGHPCSVTGTLINNGMFTVYFMTAAGFPLGNPATPKWSWRRTDRSHDGYRFPPEAYHQGVPLSWTILQTDFYYVSSTGRIVKITRDHNNVPYAISAGYYPIYGRDLETFYGHIIVVGATGPMFPTGGMLEKPRVAWSDNIEPNTFFPTDTNEADSYVLPASVALAPRKALAWKDTLFIFTSGKSYYTNYLGLPNVFSFAPYIDINVGGESIQAAPNWGPFLGDMSIARGAQQGVYILSQNRIYSFNGASFTDISNQLTGVVTKLDRLFYSPDMAELYAMTLDHRLFVYQEITGTWHEEYASFAATKGWIVCIGVMGFQTPITAQGLYGPCAQRVGMQDATPGGVKQDDVAATGGYGKPTLRTQMLSGGMFGLVKEATGGYYIGTLPKDTKVVTPRWYVCEDGKLVLANVASNPNSVLTALSRDGTLSFPRVAFRGLVLEIELSDTDPAKFPGKSDAVPQEMSLIGLELEVTGTWPQQAGSNTPSQ